MKNDTDLGDVVDLAQLALLVLVAFALFRAVTNWEGLPTFDNLRDLWRWLIFGPTEGTSEAFRGDEGQSAAMERAEMMCAADGGVQALVEGIANPFATCWGGTSYDLTTGSIIPPDYSS